MPITNQITALKNTMRCDTFQYSNNVIKVKKTNSVMLSLKGLSHEMKGGIKVAPINRKLSLNPIASETKKDIWFKGRFTNYI